MSLNVLQDNSAVSLDGIIATIDESIHLNNDNDIKIF